MAHAGGDDRKTHRYQLPAAAASARAQTHFTGIANMNFDFDIYASGEYSGMLERELPENDA